MIRIPEALSANILNTYSEQGRLWLEQLPGLIDKYLDLWSLEPIGEITGQTFNFVLPVRSQRAGYSAILKLGPHLKGRRREGLALKAYGGHLAPRLLSESSEDGALLIEAIFPGQSLEELLGQRKVSESEASWIGAKLIRELISGKNVRQNEPMTSVDVWGLGFEKFEREKLILGHKRNSNFPDGILRRADQIFKELQRTSDQTILLHGDLHHGNILKSEDNGWCVIDPKGASGDPAYEVGAFLRNPFSQLALDLDLDSTLRERLKIFCEVLPFKQERIWGWAYSQAVLAAIWTVEDQQLDWRNWLRIAESFERIRPDGCFDELF